MNPYHQQSNVGSVASFWEGYPNQVTEHKLKNNVQLGEISFSSLCTQETLRPSALNLFGAFEPEKRQKIDNILSPKLNKMIGNEDEYCLWDQNQL